MFSSYINNLGSLFTANMASAGTFTTFALMLNCLPLGFSRNCINGIRGATKRSSNDVKSSSGGLFRKTY